jgi:hypothetical protein
MTETTKGAVGRKRKKNGFTQISNILIEDSRLSWKAKGILMYLMSRPDNWKVNKTDLQKKAVEGRDSVQSGLDELKELGYLHIYQKNNENGQFNYIWEYDDEPFTPDILKNHTTENPQNSGDNMQNTHVRENRIRENRQRDSSILNNTVFNNTVLNNTEYKEIKTNMSVSPKKLEEEFELLWKMYPRKIGKKKAFDSFKKARKVKKVPYETIENGLYRYLKYIEQQELEETFIQHGSTFFNQEKWQDEFICTGVNKKPKNATEYLRAKYSQGEDYFESFRDRETIDYYSEVVPEPFQGF